MVVNPSLPALWEIDFHDIFYPLNKHLLSLIFTLMSLFQIISKVRSCLKYSGDKIFAYMSNKYLFCTFSIYRECF